MRVAIVGGTGFIGRSLVQRLLGDGHVVRVLARSEQRARAVLGGEVEVVPLRGEVSSKALEGVDAVVNLSGEAVLPKRWTPKRKAELTSSRVELTRQIVSAISRLEVGVPKILINASAIGFYGDTQDREVDEAAPAGEDFLARLCADWEHEALSAEKLGLRVVVMRIGIVLGREGGVLGQLRLPFSLGLGGPIGSGRQYFSWIHQRDLVDLFATAIEDERYSGIFNATAPEPVEQRVFARELGNVLHRPAWIPAPAPAVRLVLGEAASALLGGQRVIPRRATELGFSFSHPSLSGALRDLLGDDKGVGFTRAQDWPPSEYLDDKKPKHLLRSDVVVSRPIDEVFDFFSKASNLGAITPEALSFEIYHEPASIEAGTRIDYRIRVGRLPMRWRTKIESFVPGRSFVDLQEVGPYRLWWHEHTFMPESDGTRVIDRVFYRVPFGIFGDIAHALFVRPMLRRIFIYRVHVMMLRFRKAGARTPHRAAIDRTAPLARPLSLELPHT